MKLETTLVNNAKFDKYALICVFFFINFFFINFFLHFIFLIQN
jgi:hypothetical protein